MRKIVLSSFALFGALIILFTGCEVSVFSGSDAKSDYKLEKDSYEPDNDYFTKNTISFGTNNRQTHSIYDENSTAADVDHIKLNAEAGKYYKIQSYAANGDSLDTMLNLHKADAALVATNDTNGSSPLAMIDWWKCETTAPYLIKVTATAAGYYGIDVEEFSGVMITSLPYTETFEGVDTAPWTDWVKDNFVTNSGTGAIRTAPISDSEETSMQLMADIPASGKTLTFSWRVGSEERKDYFIFYLDGEEIEKISGTSSWAKVTTALTSGKHLIKWEYKKNSSKSSEPYDCAWLDDISIQ